MGRSRSTRILMISKYIDVIFVICTLQVRRSLPQPDCIYSASQKFIKICAMRMQNEISLTLTAGRNAIQLKIPTNVWREIQWWPTFLCQPNKLRQFATRGKLKGAWENAHAATCQLQHTHAQTLTFICVNIIHICIQYIATHVLNPFANSFIIHHIKCFITRCASSLALVLSVSQARLKSHYGN